MNNPANNQDHPTESRFARLAFLSAWIPVIGFIPYMLFAFLGLVQIGKGQVGYYRLRNGLFAVFFLSILPIAGLILWAELPNEYYLVINQFTKHGRYTNNNEQGLLVLLETYRFGKPFKKTVLRYRNNILSSEEHFYYGKRHGHCQWFYQNEKLERVVDFDNGKINGEFNEWYSNGLPRFTSRYQQGIPIGEWQCWFENGKTSSKGQYKDGKIDGQWTFFYDNGKKRMEVNYQNGQVNGEYSIWYDNAQLAVKGSFINGERIGKWITYDKSGKIVLDIADYQKWSKSDSVFDSAIPYQVSVDSDKDSIYDKVLGKTPTDGGITIPAELPWRIDRLPSVVTLNEIGENLTPRLVFEIGATFSEFHSDNLMDVLMFNAVDNVDYSGKSCLTNSHMTFLRGLPNRYFNFGNQEISDIGLNHFAGMRLTALNISQSTALNDAGLELLRDMPLERLFLSGCSNITDSGMANLAKMPLKVLYLSTNRQITDEGLANIKDLKLTTLSLYMCEKITDTGLENLKNMPLFNLNLYYCDKITDNGLANLKGLPLTNLVLGGCSKITDSGLANLKGMSLVKLDLYNCRLITDKGLLNLKGMPLNKLDLSDCAKISEKYRKDYTDATAILTMLDEIKKSE